MSVTGKVKNGVVVLPPDVVLPEGTAVRVETLEVAPEDDPLVSAIRKLARPRPHLPKDYALNHGRSGRAGSLRPAFVVAAATQRLRCDSDLDVVRARNSRA